jgi:hypothetical protein
MARQRERELIAAADRHRALRRERGPGRFSTLLARIAAVRSETPRPAPCTEQATEAS